VSPKRSPGSHDGSEPPRKKRPHCADGTLSSGKPIFRRYISQVLHGTDSKISGQGMGLLNKLVESIADDVWKTAILITQKNNRKTVGSRDANTATTILFTRKLMAQFNPFVKERLDQYVATSRGEKSHPVTRSDRAQLLFSVGRVERLARSKHLRSHQRISSTCAVYVSSVLEFITKEIIKESEAVMQTTNKKILTPRHFLLGIANNADLGCLVQNYNIINAGVVPTHAASRGQSGGASANDEDDGYEYDECNDGEQHGGKDGYPPNVTKAGIVRLMRRAGVERVGNMNSGTYETSLSIIDDALGLLLKATIAMLNHRRLKTIRVREVVDAIEILNELKQAEVFKINLQGNCLSDINVKHAKPNRSPRAKSQDAAEADLVADSAPKRKSKPGVKARRDIKRYQNTVELLLQPTGFSRAIRYECDAHNSDTRHSATALRFIQSIVENYLVGIFQDANKLAAHAKRKTLLVKDILLTQRSNDLGMCV
jgi:histone H3/H4